MSRGCIIAVDTRLKRQSATCMLVPSMLSGVYPDTSGVVQAEWQATPWMYSGITAISGEYILTAEPGSYDLTGSDVDLLYDRIVAIEAGSYVLTGIDVDLLHDKIVTIEAGSFIIDPREMAINGDFSDWPTNNPANFITFYITSTERLIETSGACRLVSQSAQHPIVYQTYNVTPGDQLRFQVDIIDVAFGDFRIGILDVTHAPSMVYGPGDTGWTTPGQTYGYSFTVPVGCTQVRIYWYGDDSGNNDITIDNWSLTKETTVLLHDKILFADIGPYLWIGFDTNLLYGYYLSADSGSFAWTGTDVDILLGRILSAESGSYLWTGLDVSLLYSGAIVLDPSLYFTINTLTPIRTIDSLTINRTITPI